MKKQFTRLIGACCVSVFLLLISTTGALAQYCASSASNTDPDFGEWITNVVFAGIDNPSGNTGYSDFTTEIGTVVPGVSYEFSGTLGNPGDYTEYITVYIDWDQSETWDAGEVYQIGSCGSDGCVITGNVDVPFTATPGETRMRVVLRFNAASTDPCDQFLTFGEVEDYTINVQSGECTPPSLTYSVVNNCADDTYAISVTANDLGSSSSATIFHERSDGVPISNTGLNQFTTGVPLTFATAIPFGVTVRDSIVSGNPLCTLIRNFQEEICPAENDEACTAIELFCGDTLSNQVFLGATQSIDDNCGGSGTADVWFKFVADGTQNYFIEETETDVIVDLWLGDDCGTIEQIEDCVDFGENFTVTEAGTYYFRIRPYSTATTYGVALTCTPFDCPGLGNFGQLCDDNDPSTYGDEITEDCVCAGIVPVPGQICEVPLEVGSLPYSAAGITSDFFDDYETTDVPPLANGAITNGTGSTTYLTGDEVVYAYTPSELEVININTTNDNDWVSLWVFTGCPFASTYAYHTSTSGDTRAVEGLVVQPGTTYYIVISSWGSILQSTEYTLNIESIPFDCPTLQANIGAACDDQDPNTSYDTVNDQCVCAGIPNATNDEICDAISLACGDTLLNQTFGGATPTYEDDCANPENGDIWFSTTVDEGFANIIEFDGDALFTVGALIGDDCGNLQDTLLSCFASVGSLFLDSAATYYIRVRPNTTVGASGLDILMNCYEKPENSECSTAFEVDCGGTYEGNTVASIQHDADQPFCGTSAPSVFNKGLWYTYTPTSDVLTTFDLGQSLFDTKIFLYTNTCDSLVCVDGDDDSGDDDGIGNSFTSLLTDTLFANNTYYVYVTGYGNARGEVFMDVSCIDLECSPTIDNVVAVNQSGDSLACVDFEGEYYVEVTISGGTQSAYNLSVNDGSPVSISPDGSAIVGPVAGGETANISIYGTINESCSANASFTPGTFCPPSNDDACGAFSIACGDTISVGFLGATASIEDNCNGSSSADVWVKFVSDGSQVYTIGEGGGAYFDAVVQLFEGDDCNALTEVAACDDSPESFEVVDAGTYYFRIRPYSTFSEANLATVYLNCTDFECPDLNGNIGFSCDDGDPNTVNDLITDTCTCVGTPQIANDEACNAVSIACGDMISQAFIGASQSIDDDCNGSSSADVWVSFVSDGSQVYTISEGGGDYFDAVVQLYVGDDCGNLTEVSDCQDSPESFDVFESGTYYFRIRPYSEFSEDNEATISLTCNDFECPDLGLNIGSACDDGDPNTVNDAVTANCVCVGDPIPVNDLCSDAIVLSCSDYVVGTNVGASLNTGCDGDDRQTVWYSYTPESAGTVTLTTCNPETNFDTDLNVYTGSCDDLTCFSGFEGNGYVDGPSSCSYQSFAGAGSFEGVAGVTYYIAVTGYYATGSSSSWQGNFGLSIEGSCAGSTLTGTVSNWNSDCGGRPATVKLYEPGTATMVASYNTTVAGDGTFSVDGVEVGTFDIIVKVAGYLAKGTQDVILASGDNNMALGTIKFGDFNGNNTVDIFDISTFSSAFGSQDGNPGYNELADYNCDGAVVLFDLSAINQTYAGGPVSGDVAPL